MKWWHWMCFGWSLGAFVMWAYWEHVIRKALSDKPDSRVGYTARWLRFKFVRSVNANLYKAKDRQAAMTWLDPHDKHKPVVKVPGRCECKESRRVEDEGDWDGCPLEGGGHTAFLIQRCCECGRILGFPDSNLTLALEKGTPSTKATLKKILGEAS